MKAFVRIALLFVPSFEIFVDNTHEDSTAICRLFWVYRVKRFRGRLYYVNTTTVITMREPPKHVNCRCDTTTAEDYLDPLHDSW